MGLDLTYYEGQTPLDPDEKEGLLIPTLTHRHELDEFEQQNVEKAYQAYILKKPRSRSPILSEDFIRKVHKTMFDDVWSWAGNFRRSNKNIGVDWPEIQIALRTLLDDAIYWIENRTYSEAEIAIRFKHRLVAIHAFPNGNGRHSRLMADILMKHLFNHPTFTWGRQNLVDASQTRSAYIAALRQADAFNIEPLLAFAQS